MAKDTFSTSDLILPMLDLPDPCKVEIEISAKTVILRVGPRDWSWDRKTAKFIGAGTCLAVGLTTT